MPVVRRANGEVDASRVRLAEEGGADVIHAGGDNHGAPGPSTPGEFSGAIRHVHTILAAFGARLGLVESRFSLAASSLSGLGALQAAVAQDPHPMGRGLAACARAVLMEKL